MWIVYGAWTWLIVSSLVVFNTRGDVAAANHALPGLLFVLVLHAGVWLYQKNKRPTSPQQPAPNPTSPIIDDEIYDQIAAELSINQVHAGMMARAIAESEGDKDKAQSIYIKLRATTIAAEREQARQDDLRREAKADAKAFVDALNAKHANKAGQSFQDSKKSVDQQLVRVLVVVFVVMIVGAVIVDNQQPSKPLSSNTQQPIPQSLQSEYDQLAKTHPDFEKIAMDPAFQEWIKNQPESLKKLYASTSAEDNIVLLNIYKNTINN